MFFGVYNTTNDSGSDTCSEKAEESSHDRGRHKKKN